MKNQKKEKRLKSVLNYITNMTIYEHYKVTINEDLYKAEPYKRYINYDNFMTENITELLS